MTIPHKTDTELSAQIDRETESLPDDQRTLMRRALRLSLLAKPYDGPDAAEVRADAILNLAKLDALGDDVTQAVQQLRTAYRAALINHGVIWPDEFGPLP